MTRSSASPQPSRPAPVWRAIVAQTRMELRLTARRGENLLAIIAIPIAVLLFFQAVPLVRESAGRPIDFLVPGVLALAIISTSLVNLGIATGYERWYGVLKRLGASPLPRAGLVAAKLAAVAVVELIQVGVIVAIAALFLDWRPGGVSLGLVVAALALGTLAFSGLGLLLAGALRAEATLALANGLFLVFMLLGGIVVPLDQLPEATAVVARILPANALAEALRIGFGAGGDATGALATLLAWGLGASGLAALTFRWE